MTEHDIIKAESNLDVAVAHVVLVSLQSEVSVFRVNETNQGLTVPPALSIKTQSDAPSATHMQVWTYKTAEVWNKIKHLAELLVRQMLQFNSKCQFIAELPQDTLQVCKHIKKKPTEYVAILIEPLLYLWIHIIHTEATIGFYEEKLKKSNHPG